MQTKEIFKHKKEWSSDTCYNINEPWGHYVNWNKPDAEE